MVASYREMEGAIGQWALRGYAFRDRAARRDETVGGKAKFDRLPE
jgi:hypothetical protein